MYKILLNLGLAKRAGQIVSGTDMVIEGLRNNSIYLVFLAKDTALNTTKKITKALPCFLTIFIFSSKNLTIGLPKHAIK